jgi:hypothetical protein
MPSKKSSAFCQYLYYIAFAGVFLRGEINKCAVNGYDFGIMPTKIDQPKPEEKKYSENNSDK